MDTKTIFVLTAKGEDEVAHRVAILDGDIKRALSMVDGVSSFAEMSKRAAPSLRNMLEDLIKDLLKRGFVEEKSKAASGAGAGAGAKIVVPPKMSVPKNIKQEQGGASELDFTSVFRVPSAADLRAEASKVEVTKPVSTQAVETVNIKAEQDAKIAAAAQEKQAAEVVRAKAEQEVQQRALDDSGRRARAQAEFARLKAEQDAEVARKEADLAKKRADVESKARDFAERRAKIEAEALRVKTEQESLRVKAEFETARLKAEAESQARAAAEEKIKQAAEAARAQAEQAAAEAKAETERIKREAEQAAAQAKAEHERIKREAELAASKAKEEHERIKREAELAASKAKEEHERIKREAELAASKAKEDAERVKREAELAANHAKQEAERVKRETEVAAARAREEAERVKREAELAAAHAKEEAGRLKRDAELAAAEAKQEAERVKREAELATTKAKEDAERLQREAALLATQARQEAEQDTARVRAELAATKQKAQLENQARLAADTARIAAERAAELARAVAPQDALLDQLEQNAIKAREEEQIRAKQLALSTLSTQVRTSINETGQYPAYTPKLKLDTFDIDALTPKPVVQVEAAPVIPVVAPSPVLDIPALQESSEKMPTVDEILAKEAALKEQIKKSEEERLAEQRAAKKLADAQAQAWADAEQRAVEAAKSHANYQVEQIRHSEQIKQQGDKKLRAVQHKRKAIPWGGISAALLVLAVLAIFLVPMVMPTQEYAAKLEKILADKLQQPVHIGKLSGHILPTPRLDLGEVYIGEIKQIKADQAQLSFGYAALFGDVKRVDRLELIGAELNGSGLLDVPAWLQKISADAKYPVTKIVFTQAKLNGDAIQLADLNGEVNFTAAGQFNTGVLRANAGKLSLEIKSLADNKLAAVFSLKNSALPLFPNWNFEDLTAQGELTHDAFIIEDFDGHIAEGGLQGKAKIDWKSAWNTQGSLNAKSISLTKIDPLLTGVMDGAATFKMQAASLAKLSDSATLEGNIAVKKGVIDGVDIIETARLHSKENLPGGRTHFDEINSALTYSNDAYHFRSMKIVNSVLNSNGSMDVVKQQLSGHLAAHLSIQEGMGMVDLQVGGAVSNPTLRAGR